MDEINSSDTSSPKLSSDGTCNIPDYILMSIGRFKDRVAQVDAGIGEEITFAEIIGRTIEFDKHLKQNGMKFGEVVAILSKNTCDVSWLILGVLAAGGVCALLNPLSTAREIQHFVDLTKPSIVIAPSLSATQLQIFDKEDCIERVYTECSDLSSSKVHSYNKTVQKLYGQSFRGRNPQLSYLPVLSDPAFYLPSSGSTGLPKAVVLSHGNIIASLENGRLLQRFNGISLGLSPFFHAFGLGIMLQGLCQGSKLIIPPKFSITSLLQTISEYQITHLFLVPSLMITLGKSDDVRAHDLKSVREVMTSAGVITREQQMAFKRKLSQGTRIFHAFGMTETTFIVFWAEIIKEKPGSIGKPIQGFKFKIINDDGEPLKNGEVGELLIRGPSVFQKYLNNVEATKETLDRYRWVHSGDLVYKDDDDYYFYVERKKDMIKYQGYQISPSEIEMVLLQHKAVQDAVVIGIKDDNFGEIPQALVVKKHGENVNESELLELVKEQLSPYKQLRGGVNFTDALPRNSIGKIMRSHVNKTAKKDLFAVASSSAQVS